MVRKLIVVLAVLLGLVTAYCVLQWNAAFGTEEDVYARTATPEKAQQYLDWAEGLKTQPTLHHLLLTRFGPLKAHVAERAAIIEAARLAAEEAAAKAAAAEAAKNALTPEQRRARWVEDYQASAAAVPEGVRTAMTTLLTRAAAEQRAVPLSVEESSEVGDPLLKTALDAVHPGERCTWDARKTAAFVDFGPGDPAVEGVRVRIIWLDAKDPLDIDVLEDGAMKKRSLKLAKARLTLDLRAPNAQPIHLEQEAAVDTADLAPRIKQQPGVADVYSALAASLGPTVCAKVSAMLGL